MVARFRTIGTVVVAVLVAPVIAQVAWLSPSDARPGVIVRPQPSSAATVPARPSLALPIPEADAGMGLAIPEADSGRGLPIPELLSRMSGLDGRLPSIKPPAAPSLGIGEQFELNCTACARLP